MKPVRSTPTEEAANSHPAGHDEAHTCKTSIHLDIPATGGVPLLRAFSVGDTLHQSQNLSAHPTCTEPSFTYRHDHLSRSVPLHNPLERQ